MGSSPARRAASMGPSKRRPGDPAGPMAGGSHDMLGLGKAEPEPRRRCTERIKSRQRRAEATEIGASRSGPAGPTGQVGITLGNPGNPLESPHRGVGGAIITGAIPRRAASARNGSASARGTSSTKIESAPASAARR